MLADQKSIFRCLICLTLMISMLGCTQSNLDQPTPTDQSPSPTRTLSPTIEPSKTKIPTNTVTPTNSVTPTETASDTPTSTNISPAPTTTPTSTPSSTSTLSGGISSDAIVIYFVLHGDNFADECQYILVPLTIGINRSNDTEKDIATALDRLFSAGQYSGQLYNATYTSSFRTDHVDFKKSSGKAAITLSGSYVKPKDSCDASQYHDQVWSTARQFPEVSRADFLLDNGLLLGDLLYALKDNN